MTRPDPRGWCPSLFEPMESGDGLLVRVRPRHAVLTTAGARSIAAAANRWGNGVIETTSRANLQIRGLAPDGVTPFAEAMVAAGLADPAARRRPDVLASPLAGDDPTASPHATDLVIALEERLADETALAALPPKFGFLVDAGGVLGLATVRADIRLRLLGQRCEIGLDGTDLAVSCRRTQAAAAAVALAQAFLALARRDPAPRRMGDLVRAVGADSVFAAAGLSPGPATPPAAAAPEPIGWLRYPGTPRAAFGLGLAFGALAAADLIALAEAADHFADGTLRVTPWRAILFTGSAAPSGPRWDSLGRSLGMVVDAADPRRRVMACPGRPACASGAMPTRPAAAALALSGLPGVIHVSGCAKGCAHPGPAAITLVGRDGAFDVLRDGRAEDPPHRHGVQVEEAIAWLRPFAETAV
ncbi:MAG: precorrin-3B synthase [Acetobacteraceae bacterium]